MNIPPNSNASQPSSSHQNKGRPIRVLVVDDSAFMRFTLTSRLNAAEGITVVSAAHDGKEALELIGSLKPDVVTLDIEMPHMDGLTTLQQIMAKNPIPVIMVSSLTTEGARETIQALTWGAVDFIAKPASKANIDTIIEDLIAKIRRAASARVFPSLVSLRPSEQYNSAITSKQARPRLEKDKIVVIGSSTGGPRALNTVVSQLSPRIPAAFLMCSICLLDSPVP